MANTNIARIMSPAEAAGDIEEVEAQAEEARRVTARQRAGMADVWRHFDLPDEVIRLAHDRTITDEERGSRLRELAKSEGWPRARRAPSSPDAADNDRD